MARLVIFSGGEGEGRRGGGELGMYIDEMGLGMTRERLKRERG